MHVCVCLCVCARAFVCNISEHKYRNLELLGTNVVFREKVMCYPPPPPQLIATHSFLSFVRRSMLQVYKGFYGNFIHGKSLKRNHWGSSEK